MRDEHYAEFAKGLREAIKSILVEMSADEDRDTVAYDELCLAVKRKFPKVEFFAITREVEGMLKGCAIENEGYECRLPVLEVLARIK